MTFHIRQVDRCYNQQGLFISSHLSVPVTTAGFAIYMIVISLICESNRILSLRQAVTNCISKFCLLCWQVEIFNCHLSDYVCKLKSTSIFLPRQTVMISQGLVGRINFARFVNAHPAIMVIYFETRFKLVIFHPI